MKGIVHENGTLEVVLSERNLLALLDKVRQPNESATTLYRRGGDGEAFLVVRAEPDGEHYKDRTPGEMSAKSEAFIKEHHS